jgi:hypothetical protein
MAKIVTEETNVVKGAPGKTAVAQTVSSQEKAEKHDTAAYLVYFLVGVVETLLGFRFVLRLLGANPVSGFVRFVYSITQLLILPFEGIFRRAATTGVETTAFFEPATLVAMVVYALVGWGIIQLIAIMAGKTMPEME